MAVPKKGWRKLTVDNRCFYWRSIGTDTGITVVVVTDSAFVGGETAQQLRFELDYDHRHTPIGNGAVSLSQQAAVTPKVVRLAIDEAITLNPAFTGDIGTEDIFLSSASVRRLQQKARVVRQQ